jgi:Tfp pilus assembly protein PilO
MEEKDPGQLNNIPNETAKEPEIITNDYGLTKDDAVVIEEPTRTVLLTEDQTIVLEKQPVIDLVPKNRPRKVYAGMWGTAEIATLGGAALAVLVLILVYLFVVMPSNAEVERTRTESDRLERDLIAAKAKYGDIADSKTHAAKLLSSVDDFQARFLPIETIGRTALYQRINGLIASYGLINTTGPIYSPLEIAGSNDGPQTDEEKGKAKFKSLFPGIYITMTVEGSYQSLRRFIREVETTQQFVVISTIALEPSDAEKKEKEAGQQPQPVAGGMNPGGPGAFPGGSIIQQPASAQVKGKMHGETVALRLEMAAYFRRPDFAPQPLPETTEQ